MSGRALLLDAGAARTEALVAGLAAGIRTAGWDAARATVPPSAPDLAAAARGAVGDDRAGLVVAAAVHPAALERSELVRLDEDAWIAAGEWTLEVARALLPPVHAALAVDGGTLVFVVPAVPLYGAAGFTPLATALEGLRALAKSAAKQWASDGVRVDVLVVAPHHFVGDQDPPLEEIVSLAGPAYGHGGDPEVDLAPLVAALGGADATFLTGATVVADGGSYLGL